MHQLLKEVEEGIMNSALLMSHGCKTKIVPKLSNACSYHVSVPCESFRKINFTSYLLFFWGDSKLSQSREKARKKLMLSETYCQWSCCLRGLPYKILLITVWRRYSVNIFVVHPYFSLYLNLTIYFLMWHVLLTSDLCVNSHSNSYTYSSK